jgi:hypothetical protein
VSSLLQDDEGLSHFVSSSRKGISGDMESPGSISAPRLLIVAPDTFFFRSCSNILAIRA